MNPRIVKARSYHHGNLREALMDEAIRSLRRHGVEYLSLRDLARAIGVSQAAPYRHFPDKDSLLAELATRGFRQLAQAMRAGLTRDGLSPAQALQATGVSYVEFAIRHPEQYRLMFGSYSLDKARHAELLAAAREAYAILDEAIRRGVEAGEFRAEPMPSLAAAAWSIVHGLASLIIDKQLQNEGTPHSSALAENVTRLLLDGIGSSAKRSKPTNRGKRL